MKEHQNIESEDRNTLSNKIEDKQLEANEQKNSIHSDEAVEIDKEDTVISNQNDSQIEEAKNAEPEEEPHQTFDSSLQVTTLKELQQEL